MYSELRDGMLLELPINYCKQLIRNPDPILGELKKYVSFEIAIGVNGRYLILFFFS